MMQTRIWIVALSLAAGYGAAAARAGDVAAVEPGGPGILTKCRDWVIAHSCKEYRHIALPARIQVGDSFTVSFGSSPKEFVFTVARIDLKSHHCAIFSELDSNRHKIDKINVAPCHPAKAEGR
jgi:hypothetical protein